MRPVVSNGAISTHPPEIAALLFMSRAAQKDPALIRPDLVHHVLSDWKSTPTLERRVPYLTEDWQSNRVTVLIDVDVFASSTARQSRWQLQSRSQLASDPAEILAEHPQLAGTRQSGRGSGRPLHCPTQIDQIEVCPGETEVSRAHTRRLTLFLRRGSIDPPVFQMWHCHSLVTPMPGLCDPSELLAD